MVLIVGLSCNYLEEIKRGSEEPLIIWIKKQSYIKFVTLTSVVFVSI